MLKVSVTIAFLFSITINLLSCVSQDVTFTAKENSASKLKLISQLKALKGVRFKEIESEDRSSISLELFVTQYLDAQIPTLGTYEQRVFLSHVDERSPVVLNTSGYTAKNAKRKALSRALYANQISVEHRYFGQSANLPKWKYLNIRHSSDDIHRVVQLLKPIYKGKWISTGRSKGGMTAIFHRRFYPDDVDVTIPEVAPISLALEDKRYRLFLNNVGTVDRRKDIRRFQSNALSQREQIIDIFNQSGMHFDRFGGAEMVFEFSVLEFEFYYWQYSSHIELSKNISDPNDIYKILDKVVDISGTYSNKGVAWWEPYFYQSRTQLGGYSIKNAFIEPLLKSVKSPTFLNHAPQNTKLNYSAQSQEDVTLWLKLHGHKIAHIYGGIDPYTAAAVSRPLSSIDALYFVTPGIDHKAGVATLTAKQYAQLSQKLYDWIGYRLPEQSEYNQKRDDD